MGFLHLATLVCCSTPGARCIQVNNDQTCGVNWAL